MNEAILKAKVLFGFGLLVSFFGMLYRPDIVQALLPLVFCVYLASVALYFPDLWDSAKRHLKARSRGYRQATPMFQRNLSDVEVRVEAIPAIDYDNYLIPTYLRRQEVK